MRLTSLILGLFLLVSLPAAAQVAPSAQAGLLGADALLPRLEKGGLIIVMRHQRAAMAGHWDDFSKPWTDCSAQRNLSTAGYAGATETGQAFRTLEIPFGEVLASPLCRTMETARLIFGKARAEETIGHITDVRGRSEAMASRDLSALVGALKPGASNDVIVTHGGNILASYGVLLSEGDMLFFAQGTKGPALIGLAAAPDFDLLANGRLISRQAGK